ncbi:MAG TPA: hypothetical protein VGM97_02695 [Steroidobacteraceae bacterium]|jgi:hypothetical protein
MTTSKRMIAIGVAALTTCVSGMSLAGTTEPSHRALNRAVTHYLSDHGDLCVGKFSWPRIVTQEDQQAGSNDAVQLPVLERLGLVESTEIPTRLSATQMSSAPAAAVSERSGRLYSLTRKGRQYYLQKKRVTLGAHGQPAEHDEDLCVGRLSLDKVIKWSPPEQDHGHLQTVVRYTYQIKSANWMADPEARKAFPVVDRIIRGRGNLLMSVTVQLKDGRWMPVLPGQ